MILALQLEFSLYYSNSEGTNPHSFVGVFNICVPYKILVFCQILVEIEANLWNGAPQKKVSSLSMLFKPYLSLLLRVQSVSTYSDKGVVPKNQQEIYLIK